MVMSNNPDRLSLYGISSMVGKNISPKACFHSSLSMHVGTPILRHQPMNLWLSRTKSIITGASQSNFSFSISKEIYLKGSRRQAPTKNSPAYLSWSPWWSKTLSICLWAWAMVTFGCLTHEAITSYTNRNSLSVLLQRSLAQWPELWLRAQQTPR